MSPVARRTTVYDVSKMNVYPLLTDLDTSASPTYGAGMEVIGVDALQLTPNLQNAELKGSSRVIARRSKVDRWQGQATYGKLDLDVINAIMGGSAPTDSGSTSVDWTHGTDTASNPYFGVAIQISDVEIGDVHLFLYKCQITDAGLLNQSSDNYGQPTFNFDAIPLDSTTHRDLRIRFLATKTALPTDLATVL